MADLKMPGDEWTAAPAAGGAWESPGRFSDRLIVTVRAVLFEPRAFFATMPRSGGVWQPLLFYILIASVGFVVSLLFQLAMTPGTDRGTIVALPFIVVGVAIFAPVLLAIGAFIGAGIYHLMLLLLGAATEPIEATFRVLAYSAGATSVIGVLPLCGGLIASVWQVVVTIVGLSEVHRTSTGKAAAAVLIPAVICCAAIASVGLFALLAVLAAARGGR